MPKRSRKDEPEPDENEVAARVVSQATEPEDDEPSIEEELASLATGAAKILGSLGGRKGGPARAAKLTRARRKEIAQKAAKVRWKGHKKKAKRKASKKGRTPPRADLASDEKND